VLFKVDLKISQSATFFRGTAFRGIHASGLWIKFIGRGDYDDFCHIVCRAFLNKRK